MVTVFPPAVGPAFGLRLLTVGAPKAYLSPDDAALVPPGVVTLTSTVPWACAGATALTWLEETKVTELDAVDPKWAPSPDTTNPVPLMVTVFPPAAGPALGLRLVTVGSESYLYLSADEMALVPVDPVTVTST